MFASEKWYNVELAWRYEGSADEALDLFLDFFN